ncbi:lytic transglycosylase domain-containing protein [Parvibium lacunae]|uniref:Lytic transglycosylase domain-containing protein n=1 Tax=Parvibium lacunae TaxID=1888893 RepID=A0A368L1T7_9BURK|nr:lytic transglycosylase domain-containing protein [Parvibium lacunae]RCS57526.1 lytic transglycosylase domain-containing protein [Parvibium lacunae]
MNLCFSPMFSRLFHLVTRFWYGLRVTTVFVLCAFMVNNTAIAKASDSQKSPSRAQPQNDSFDDLILNARDAVRLGDSKKLQASLSRWRQLDGPQSQYVLNDYLGYWEWRQKLVDARQNPLGLDQSALRQWLAARPGQLVSDLLRRDWLQQLARQGQWERFRELYPAWVLRDERDLLCYEQVSQLENRQSSDFRPADWRLQTRQLLLQTAQSKEFPEGCQELLSQAIQQQLFSLHDGLELLRLLFANNRGGAALRLGQQLQAQLALGQSNISLAYERPLELLRQLPAERLKQQPAHQELAVLAIVRLTREQVDEAAQQLTLLAPALSARQQGYLWGQIGMAGAKRLHEQAIDWMEKADASQLNAEILEWKVRAALRAQRWDIVQRAIENMDEPQRRDPTWIYWLGRAYQAQGQAVQAEQQFRVISPQFGFYSKLAQEELGLKIVLPPVATAPSETERQFAQQHPGLKRALKFYALGLRFEGNREWNFALRGLSDRQLLAVADYAKQLQIYDRAINTAERTQQEHDFNLRFLTPYRQELALAAQRAGVDEPFVYGLIRQESRFITDAKSQVGASGLMQLMPATAKYVARKIGWHDFHGQEVNDVGTNLTLGTRYLRMVLDSLDQSPVLATAAYNAGPGRPRAWRARAHYGKAIEGAIFAETIPFTETRDYVKKVLSNTVYYAAQFEGRAQSLKTRLGVIQPTTPQP